jgi:RhtB (resistance to homoserine/threonine) family protein
MFENFHLYWIEFIAIAGVHFFAVASPGPDFAIVLKHSVGYGRRAAVVTSIGIGLGILIHVAYSLLGIGLLIKTTPWLFNILIYVASAYLAYLGWGAIRSGPNTEDTANEDNAVQESTKSISDKKAFLVGFMTNGLNPKATLFFLFVFATVVSSETPNNIKVIYGLYMAFATGCWFAFLSYCVSFSHIRRFLRKNGYWFDRLMGAVLIGLALHTVLSNIR